MVDLVDGSGLSQDDDNEGNDVIVRIGVEEEETSSATDEGIQGDTSRWSKPPFDIDLKVVLYYKVLLLQRQLSQQCQQEVLTNVMRHPVVIVN